MTVSFGCGIMVWLNIRWLSESVMAWFLGRIIVLHKNYTSDHLYFLINYHVNYHVRVHMMILLPSLGIWYWRFFLGYCIRNLQPTKLLIGKVWFCHFVSPCPNRPVNLCLFFKTFTKMPLPEIISYNKDVKLNDIIIFFLNLLQSMRCI